MPTYQFDVQLLKIIDSTVEIDAYDDLEAEDKLYSAFEKGLLDDHFNNLSENEYAEFQVGELIGDNEGDDTLGAGVFRLEGDATYA